MSYTVYVRGTFNVLTEGHRRLLSKAVECMDTYRHIEVGVTLSRWADKEVPVRCGEWRRLDVYHFLVDDCKVRPDRVETVMLADNPFVQISNADATDVVVCSTATATETRAMLNKLPSDRRPRLVVVPHDGSPSSTDIVKEAMRG